MTVVEHDSLVVLAKRFRSEPDARVAKRVWIVWQARQQRTAPQIAADLGMSRRAVQGWIRRYNERGLAGLTDAPGRGRKPRLSAAQQQQLLERLQRGPTAEDGVCTFRGVDICRLVEREFGQTLSLSAVYWLLHRLGYSSLVPRPRHRQTDAVAQEEFKKNSPAG